MPRLRLTRRVAALAIALLALVGLSLASAAQLSVDGGTIQAGVGPVVDCQPASQPIVVSFTSTFSTGAYRTTAVRFADVAAACNGLAYRVQLVDTSGVPIDTNGPAAGADMAGTVNLVGGAFTVTVTSTPTAAIGRVALVLTD